MLKASRLVVIGASAGGLEAVRDLLAGLPAGFAAAVLVVIHTSPSGPNLLTAILGRACALPVTLAVDGEDMQHGHVYVSVPDRHLLVHDGGLAVKRGPKENRFRPSVDALFRSAAYTHGASVIGVVLSGMLDDGTSGLWTIKRLGGVSVVQTPGDALYDSMPRNALDNVEVDYVLPATSIGTLLSQLVQQPVPQGPEAPDLDETERRRLEVEIQAAAEGNAFELGLLELGELSPLTCPECHGVLVRLQEGRLTRFRCHTGHAYTTTSLMSSIGESVENNLYQALRSLEEAVLLYRQMERQQLDQHDAAGAQVFREKANRAQLFAEQVQAMSSRPLTTGPDRAEQAPQPGDDPAVPVERP